MPIQPLDDPLNNSQNQPKNETSPWDEVFKPKEEPKDDSTPVKEGPQPVEELVPFDEVLKNKKEPEPEKPAAPIFEGPKPVKELSPLGKMPIVTPRPQATEPPPPPPAREMVPPVKTESDPITPLDEIPPQPDDSGEVPKAYNPYAELEGPWKEVFAKKAPEPEPISQEKAEPVPPTPAPVPSHQAVEVTSSKPEDNPVSKETSAAAAPSSTGEADLSSLSPEDLVEYYQEQLLYDPEDIDIRLKYINAFMEIGLEYELVDDYLALANCYRNQGDVENAKIYYYKVLELDSEVQEARKKLESMGEKLETAPVSSPEETSDKPGGAREIKSDKKKPEAAPIIPLNPEEQKKIDEFKRMLQLNPINDAAAYKLSDLYHAKNMIQEAVNEMANLADAYMRRGMYIKAQLIYTELLKESPSTDLRQRLAKAKTYSRSNTAIEQAIKSYEKSLKTPKKTRP